MWEKALAFIGPYLLNKISPILKEMLEESIQQWWAKAKETTNPWDNVLVSFLAGVLGIDLHG